ncbi:Calx-beta domain-containing protein [Rhodocyclaceae bacterium]
MVTTTAAYADFRYRTNPGDGYEGVVRVSFGGYYGTGSLLFDGRAILTAAHLFDGRGGGAAGVTFETSAGPRTLGSNQILTHSGYDDQGNNDLALVFLTEAAPVTADRYDIYRGRDELGQRFTLVGYGSVGTGATGATDSGDVPLRLKADNRFDVDIATLKSEMGTAMDWTPLAGSQLVADFDDGTAGHDAMGQLIGRIDTGYGLDEGLSAQGDSGGPGFLDGRIAGVSSYIASLDKGAIQPDIDAATNSSFGEIAAWQRVSFYQQWIDQSMRAHYPDAPTKPAEVKQTVVEGNSGTSYAYFLLQFTGVRSNPNQILSVDYATRDGIALAGEDYLAVSGTLRLYPDENQAVIPVEIVGDTTPEPGQTFYLDVFNPVGGSFGAGTVKLTAVRTILDDDGWAG